MKIVLIPTEFKRIDMRQWPKYVRDFIENPDVNAIHPDNGSKIAYHRFNTEAYPRLLFFEERDTFGNIVYVLRKFFDKHETYDAFRVLSETEKLNKAKYSELDRKELDDVLSGFIIQKPKSPLPQEMRDYEKMRDFSNTATTYVFEMEEWCKHINNKELEDDRKDIFDAIQRIVIYKENTKTDSQGWSTINFAGNKEIVFRVHEKDSHAYYFLFEIGNHVDKNNLYNKYIDLSDSRLLKQARKGYPDWILYGEFDDWKKLENDDEANLALSDEEVKVLNKTLYPYFINGLAGSGKSTILYYLFAHAYSYKNVRPLDLLFLSYSPKLVTKAKTVIKALLRTNPSYHGYKISSEEEKLIEQCFWPFQKFLSNKFLLLDEDISKFDIDKHVSYEKFQKDYAEKCKLDIATKYRAPIVWSVIRTFIKGRDYTSDCSVKSYAALRDSEQTVSVSDFENIHKIWENWYKPSYEELYWDDLDLVRYILKKMDDGFEYKKYDIIYCDEAQDFTPIENKLILRLSKYTDYDLKKYSNIPIAYAGDPNQTVSPTGFNWKRLKDIFDTTFSDLIGSHIQLQEKTLNNNYRSKRTIVEFANSLQYLRKCFLTDDILHPQEQWNPQANPLPGFFFLTRNDGNENDSQTIKAGFAKTECIITGAEGEYERELEGTGLTADSTKLDDELLATIDNKTKLYTAISSKGLEFPAVLLYRFADQLPASFGKILNRETNFSPSDRYDLAHFFTKLYIAVSRAKEVLYIADTQENFDKFWKYFIDNFFIKELMSGRQDAATWQDKVGGIELGKKNEYLARMSENFNPLETALRIYEDAKMSRSSKDMNRAVGYFEEAGDFTKAEECRAFVLLYESEYLKSGQKFAQLGNAEEATKAFWQGCCWKELIVHSDRIVYKLAARFMEGDISLIDFIQTDNIIDSFNRLDPTWGKIVVKIGESAKDLDNSLLYAVNSFLEQLADRGFVSLNPTIAEIYFKTKQYAKAAQKWETIAELTHDNHYCDNKEYYQAKEEQSLTISDKLFWMSKGGKTEDILKVYSSPKAIDEYSLDDRAKRIIFSLLLRPQTYSQALEYPYNGTDKLPLLYKADRIKFIEQYVLEDFSDEKFITWIEHPLTDNESDLFEKEIPQSLFDKIFALPVMNNWILFMKLVDNGGYRVMRNEVNIHRVTDSISAALSRKNYISLASCFLDVLFNSPYYNHANANKYLDTLLKIFRNNDFTYKDFLSVSKRNKYFDACGLTGHDLDIIKERLREFIKVKLNVNKKVKSSDVEMVRTLLKIYEKAAPQVQSNGGKFVYDYESVLNFYNTIRRNSNLPDEIKKYIDIRKAVISAQHKDRQTLASFEQSLPGVSYRDVTNTFDKEDAVWLVRFIFGNKNVNEKAGLQWGLLLSRLIYNFNISLMDIDNAEIRKRLKENFIGYADEAITKILSHDRIDEYSFKIHSYLYEVFMDGDSEKAKKYQTLSQYPRIDRLYGMVQYLRNRALHFYAYGSENIFNMRAAEWNSPLSMAVARDKTRPQIEEKQSDTKIPIDSTLVVTQRTNGSKDTAPIKAENKDKKGETSKPRRTKKQKEIASAPISEAKKAQLTMAKNLKSLGIDDETILKSAPDLSAEDLKNL